MGLTTEEMIGWWEGAARANAMTAILSNESAWDEKEFFGTGDAWLKEAIDFADQARVRLSGEVAVDWGCGIGRVAHALSKFYRKVIGVDISPEMIRIAREHGRDVAEFVQLAEPPLARPDQSVDLSFSTIVIQHIPAPHNIKIVDELFRLSRHAVLFDAPSHKLADSAPEPADGIFLLNFNEVLKAAAVREFDLLALRNFPATATRHYQYLFVKRA